MALIIHERLMKAVVIYTVCLACVLPSLSTVAARSADSNRHARLIRKWHKRRHTDGGSSDPINKPAHIPLDRHISTVWEDDDGVLLDNDGKALNPKAFKSLLSKLLTKLDSPSEETLSTSSLNMVPPPPSQNDHHHRRGGETSSRLGGHSKRHINSLSKAHHCSLHGLWLSTVAGAAIELRPERMQNHVEIHTKIFELPDNPYPPLLTSQWTGKGMISQESPTTITVVFQEHIDAEKENHAKERDNDWELQSGDKDSSSILIQLPRTAVFVGQCLVCQGNPMLQGSWVVFPSSQTCRAASGFSLGGINNGFNGNEQQGGFSQSSGASSPYAQDTIYLLHYF